MTHETEACTCPSLCGDLCHLGEGCRAMEHVRRHSEPPNFCSRCGKRLTPEGVHTCTPPMSRDAELEQARAEEREACAKVCESRQTPGTGSVAILQGAADAILARGQK
jgi:hypothetical protein